MDCIDYSNIIYTLTINVKDYFVLQFVTFATRYTIKHREGCDLMSQMNYFDEVSQAWMPLAPSQMEFDNFKSVTTGQLAETILLLKYVNYKLFGAVGDGVIDDGLAIKRCHEYANINNLPVKNLTGEYYIKGTRNIVIKTETDFTGAVVHIDESFNTGSPVFDIQYVLDKIVLDLSTINKESLLNELNSKVSVLSSLNDYSNHLVYIENSLEDAAYNPSAGATLKTNETFYLDQSNKIVGDIINTFNDITKIEIYPCDDYITIVGGKFLLNGVTSKNLGASSYSGALFRIKRSHVLIGNQTIRIEDGSQDRLLHGSNGTHSIEYSYDVSLNNIRSIPRIQKRQGTNDVPVGTYTYSFNKAVKIKMENVTTDGTDSHWGVMGTNNIKMLTIDNCALNRIDAHYNAFDVNILNTKVGSKGILLNGGGRLYINNVQSQAQEFISFRPDHGSRWDGEIIIRDSELKIKNDVDVSILKYAPGNYDYIYDIVLAKRIDINNFTFSYDVNSNKKAEIIVFPTFGKFANGKRIAFPNEIIVNNVNVLGRQKGVKFFDIIDLKSYKTDRQSDTANKIANTKIVLANIDTEELTKVSSENVSDLTLNLRALFTEPYIDSFTPVIDLIIENCKGLVLGLKSAKGFITIRNSRINAVDMYEGGGFSGSIKFNDCDFKANIVSGETAFTVSNLCSTTFDNCFFGTPTINDVLSTTNFEIAYGNIFKPSLNVINLNHIKTTIADSVLTELNPLDEFKAELKLHNGTDISQVYRKKGLSNQRPTLPYAMSGFVYYDLNLTKPIYWTNTVWKDSAGTTV